MTFPATKVLSEQWRQEDQRAIVSAYGAKSVGLARLPEAWRPPGLAISADVCRAARSTRANTAVSAFIRSVMPAITAWAQEANAGSHLILRSSSTHETLLDRGKFDTLDVRDWDETRLSAAALEICRRFIVSGAPGEMALLLHPLKERMLEGHLANFKRVSKTRNQWEFECARTDPPSRTGGRFNSQRHSAPGRLANLPSVRGEEALIDLLKQVGAWLAENVEPLVSVEWVADGHSLWLVQCDDEADPPDAVDPRKLSFAKPSTGGSGNAPEPFALYKLGDATPVRKLKLLDDFAVEGFGAAHAIHHATAQQIAPILANALERAKLAAEIDAFGPDGVVIRSDADGMPPGEGMNLPRTDSADGAKAVPWLEEKSAWFASRGVAANRTHFLVHRFIPARVSAWSFAAPDDRTVRVDSLWGIPDGIQFYPHDTVEFDLVSQTVARSRIEFKPYFIWPKSGGRWEKLSVVSQQGRCICLSREDTAYIAGYTSAVAKKLGAPAQIMWFCDFPAWMSERLPLPWYREKHALTPIALEAAPALPSVVIRTMSDIAALADSSAKGKPKKIILEPDPALIRERTFLDGIVQAAKQGGHSIVLDGSVLGHAFYQIRAAGVPVYSSRGPSRRRTLKKREFGKLVRDGIPDVIMRKGEAVTYGRVPPTFRRSLLVAKAFEELWELFEARGNAQVEELADLYEVLSALLADAGLTWEEVALQAATKRADRGGFERGIVLLGTNTPRPEDAALLPAEAVQKTEVSPERALRVAREIELTLGGASVPLLRIITEEKGTAVRVKLDGREVSLSLRLEGDRLVLQSIEKREESAPLIDVER